MARRYLMTWKSGRGEARWRKMYKGEWYSVACRKLGVPPTKEASWRAANEWWMKKKAELDSPNESHVAIRSQLIKVSQEEPQIAEGDHERIVDFISGPGSFQRLNATALAVFRTVKQTAPDRTVAAQIGTWRQLLESSCQTGQLSTSRYDCYRRDIDVFAKWIGENSPIDIIDEVKLEEFFNHMSSRVAKGEYSPATAHLLFMTARQFISRLAEMKLIQAPGNLRSRRFKFGQGRPAKVETFTIEEVRSILAACDGYSERTKLYLLLMLNTGAYQGDVSDLRQDEVDWKAGTITRARSKTRDRNAPEVTYKLWPETFALLKKHRAKSGELALVSEGGNPLAHRWIEEGKMRKYDLIRTGWANLCRKMGSEKPRLSMKHLRKTSATILGSHTQYKYYYSYFLAHSPRSTADRHYVIPSDAEFFEALGWLRDQFIAAKSI